MMARFAVAFAPAWPTITDDVGTVPRIRLVVDAPAVVPRLAPRTSAVAPVIRPMPPPVAVAVTVVEAAVALLEITIAVPLVIDTITDPAGIFVPEIAMPGASPAVVVMAVMFALFVAVVTLVRVSVAAGTESVTFAPVLPRVMRLKASLSRIPPTDSVTAPDALPPSPSALPPSVIPRAAPPRRLPRMAAELSRVSRLPRARPDAVPAPTSTFPPEPAAPAAPEMVTWPAAMVSPFCALAPVRVSAFAPTLVSRNAPLMPPESVMSPFCVTPLAPFTKFEPMLPAAPSVTAPVRVTAVLDELMIEPSELIAPFPVTVPAPP